MKRARDEEKDRMREAVWSTYFKAAGCRRSVLPPRRRPMRLEHALDVLIEHPDEHGGARRRRAALRLGAADLHDPAKARPEVAERVTKLAEHVKVAPLMDPVGRGKAHQGAILAKAPRSGIDCVAVNNVGLTIEYKPRTHDTIAESTSLVKKPLAQLESFLDPSRWSVCSDFFERSDPVDPVDYKPIAKVPPGTPWLMYERFSVPNTVFENILNILFTVTRSRIEVQYSLYDSLLYEFWGVQLPGVHERNSGFVRATPVPGHPNWTEIKMKKTLRFRDLTPEEPYEGGVDEGQWLNYSAPAMLALWLDDASQARICCTHSMGG